MAAPQPAPTRSRGFSVKSEQSQKSANSKEHNRTPSESSQDKHRRSLQTKADPLVAMNELQPIAVALQKSNLGSLREIEHKDQFGNVITDPDLSNPTRPRFERPLDTIRSFEAAIYGAYRSNRGSYARTEDAASQMGDFSRRTSYYGPQNGNGNSNGANGYGNRYDQGYYSQAQSRPDSIINGYSNTPLSPETPNPYYQNGNGNGNGNGYGRRRPNHRSPASPSSPTSPSDYPNMAQNVNSPHGYQPNGYFDNAVSNTSGSDPYGQSTDPSSMNSSNDQLQQQALQQQRMDERAQAEYGFSGFGNTKIPQQDPSWATPSGSAAPPPPAQAARPNHVRQDTNSSAKGDKRKSWFKRRFSKD